MTAQHPRIVVDDDALQYALQAYERHRKQPNAAAYNPVHPIIAAYLDGLTHQGYELTKRSEGNPPPLPE